MSKKVNKRFRSFRVFNEIIFDPITGSLREARISSPLYVKFTNDGNVAHCHLGKEINLGFTDE